jgi:ATP-dependent RNA helicase DeaD
MEGRDLMVQSRTGSGKTLAFGLPLMHRLESGRKPQAIILTPTRELAQQVAAELRSVNRGLDMAQLVGGMSYTPQLKALSEGARIIVGTPGRVMDHMERGTLDLSHVRMVVLDECDEMLNMGFIEDVEHILADVPPGPQTYLFSATLPAPIASLARRFLKDPHHVELTGSGGVAQHADISHTACLIPEHLHVKALANILLHDEPAAALIFTKMKQQTEEVAEALRNAGLAADYLHGDLNQGARNRIMGGFKAGRLRYLVATDVAARGIDVEGLPLVVNMGIPTQFENYIHRTGRTGRAGLKGTSLSLVGHKESRILLAWARRGGLNLEWRAVPSPDEIRKERSRRLGEKVRGHEAPAFEGLAESLLGEMDPKGLVAALLSLIEDEAHLGFHMPETIEPKKRGPFGDRGGPEGPWKRPGARQTGRREWGADRHDDKPRDRYKDKPDRFGDRPKDRYKDRDEPKDRARPFDRPNDYSKGYGAKRAAKPEWREERPPRSEKAAPYRHEHQDAPPPRSRKAAGDAPGERPPKRTAPQRHEYQDTPPKRSYARKHEPAEPPARGAAKKRETDKPAKKGSGFNPPWPIPGMKGKKK